MYQWFESIRIENGEPLNLNRHQDRMDQTFMHFTGKKCPFSLIFIFLDNHIPQEGIHKARIVYNLKQVEEVTFSPYAIKKIEAFKLVEDINIEYTYKKTDRLALNGLKAADFEPIITQNGLITDTSYSNLIFHQDGYWFTPSSFLLNGVMRQTLLAKGIISERDISASDLKYYSHFKMINAMMPLKSAIIYPISIIKE